MRETFYRIKHKILGYYIRIEYDCEIKFLREPRTLHNIIRIERPLYPIYKKSYFASWTNIRTAIKHLKKINEFNTDKEYMWCITNPKFLILEKCSINKIEKIDFEKYL